MNPLLIRRRGMMLAQQGGIPYDSEVEYLVGDGNSYIDTGVYLANNSFVRVDFSIGTLGTSRAVFGARDSYQVNDFSWMLKSSDNKLRRAYGTLTNESNAMTNYSIRYEYKQNGRVLLSTYDSVIYTFSVQTFSCNYPTFLFSCNNAGVPFQTANNKIYYARIEGVNKTVDLIPVRVGTVGYMYDRVSGQLFGNIGTGAFVLGPDIQ